MIKHEANQYIPTCEVCGGTLPPDDDYWDALEHKLDAGWKQRKLENRWIDVCPKCEQKENLKRGNKLCQA